LDRCDRKFCRELTAGGNLSPSAARITERRHDEICGA